MLRAMLLRHISPLILGVSALVLSSCGNKTDVPLLAGNTQAASDEGEALYQQAKQADDAGKTSRALKLYDQTATRYPFAPSAAQARFRQAEILEQQGQVVKSFDAYQQFLTRYQGSGLYSTALKRQAEMAQSAADGDVKSNFLGLKSKISLDRSVEMLGKVRDNAPKSATAARAQFTIGELYQSRGKAKESIAAFRKLVRDQPESSQAPEALFRVGVILTEEADRGNQNQANLRLAREAFDDYLIQYPGHSKNAEARKRIASLGNRDLQSSYDIAEFYERTGQLESAKVYYREVVCRAKSGPLHDAARARLKALGE